MDKTTYFNLHIPAQCKLAWGDMTAPRFAQKGIIGCLMSTTGPRYDEETDTQYSDDESEDDIPILINTK